MVQTVTITERQALDAAVAILTARDVPADDAETTARALVAADLRGIDSHGLACLSDYADALAELRFNPRPELKITHRVPWASSIDGDNGLGPVAADLAMRLALEAADAFGIGAASVKNSNHYGAAGVYALRAAERGCIGLASANAFAITAPFGARAPFFGTNPLAAAVPAGKYPPFLLDMATSAGALRKIRKALAEGTPIPEGWALDADGHPTTDPARAVNGMLLPFGGAKGSGLAMLLDILTGGLSGGLFSIDVLNSFTNRYRPAANCHVFLVLRIDAFTDYDGFIRRMEEMISRLTALPPAPGFDAVGYPGERSAATLARRRAAGIPLSRVVYDRLVELGAGLPQV